MVRDVCIIDFAHILQLCNRRTPTSPPLSQLCKKYANVFGQFFRLFLSHIYKPVKTPFCTFSIFPPFYFSLALEIFSRVEV